MGASAELRDVFTEQQTTGATNGENDSNTNTKSTKKKPYMQKIFNSRSTAPRGCYVSTSTTAKAVVAVMKVDRKREVADADADHKADHVGVRDTKYYILIVF